jgi:hypothetical protein
MQHCTYPRQLHFVPDLLLFLFLLLLSLLGDSA